MTTLNPTLGHTLHALLRAPALPVIAFIVFFEEFVLPSRLPGELKMLLAGVQAAQDIYPVWLVLIVQEVAALLGGSALHAMCRCVGLPSSSALGASCTCAMTCSSASRRRGWRALS